MVSPTRTTSTAAVPALTSARSGARPAEFTYQRWTASVSPPRNGSSEYAFEREIVVPAVMMSGALSANTRPIESTSALRMPGHA